MSVTPHSPSPNSIVPDSKVYVNGTRIPVGDVDLYIRNEGPLDMGYYTEVYFPSPWNGEDYLSLFDSVEGTDGSGMDELYVEVKAHDRDTYFPAFRGVVTGVGNAGELPDGESAPESMWKARGQGPAFYLDKTTVGSNFSGVGAQTLLNKVGSQIDSKLPFTVTVPDVPELESKTSKSGKTLKAEDNTDGQLSNAGGLVSRTERGTNESTTAAEVGDEVVTQTFTRNRHTLVDVSSWLATKIDALLYFAPTQDDVRLQPYFGGQIRSYEAHYLGGDIDVIANDALSEVNPINTLTVNGKAAKTLASLGSFEVQVGSDKFVQAIARHKPLYERAGETELHATTYTESGADSKSEVENEAKKLLRERITTATEGDMTVRLHHPITPHDGITALPTCRGSAATDTPPISYNITRVHHRIRASGLSTTKLNVGVAVEDGDIQIVDSRYKKA